MKKIAALLLSLLVYITACDKVKHPKEGNNNSNETLVDTVVHTNTTLRTVRKVMVEDYTGHFCGNCPRAARRAEFIEGQYGNKVVVMANHVSITYAAKQTDTMEYNEDFRNPDSDAWDIAFGMASKGLPEGAINRVQSPGFPQGDGVWSSLVASEMDKPQSVIMDMTTTYDTIKHLLNVDIKHTFLQAYTGKISVSIVLTQDGIVSDQKDYAPPVGTEVVDGDRRPDYEFDNMVLGTVNSTWGQLVKESPAIKDTVSIHIRGFQVNVGRTFNTKQRTRVNDKKMHVIAFVYRDDASDAAHYREILQVEKLKLTGSTNND